MRFNTQPGVRPTSQFAQQQLQLQQQRSKLLQQQQQQQQQQLKQRLLQQQQQQQLLIPSNATATDQISSGIHSIDNLLNNTVAPPNVSLQVCMVYLHDLLNVTYKRNQRFINKILSLNLYFLISSLSRLSVFASK